MAAPFVKEAPVKKGATDPLLRLAIQSPSDLVTMEANPAVCGTAAGVRKRQCGLDRLATLVGSEKEIHADQMKAPNAYFPRGNRGDRRDTEGGWPSKGRQARLTG